jgi:flagellar hook-associated protein 1 FlgK
MGETGLTFLGLTAGTITTTDPYFDVQVGNNTVTRITIEPGDTETDLVTKIDAVPGIATADIVLNASGHLSFRPERGGDIKIIGGPFTSVAAGFSTAGGLGIIQEIFGSSTPIVDHAHADFRNEDLGPNVALSTGIITATTILDFSQKVVDAQIQDKINIQNIRDDENQYLETLDKQLIDQSGVNLDEELATMIVVQSAYAAAARAISTVNDMFQELLDAFR